MQNDDSYLIKLLLPILRFRVVRHYYIYGVRVTRENSGDAAGTLHINTLTRKLLLRGFLVTGTLNSLLMKKNEDTHCRKCVSYNQNTHSHSVTKPEDDHLNLRDQGSVWDQERLTFSIFFSGPLLILLRVVVRPEVK
ncbi:unnamed protein product [Rhizophagus irregularis]|nr:unnamed protein product [Rhizophagus irregularis]